MPFEDPGDITMAATNDDSFMQEVDISKFHREHPDEPKAHDEETTLWVEVGYRFGTPEQVKERFNMKSPDDVFKQNRHQITIGLTNSPTLIEGFA